MSALSKQVRVENKINIAYNHGKVNAYLKCVMSV